MEIIFIIASAQALFFSILLFLKKNRDLSDKIMGIWLFAFAVHFIFPYIKFSDFPNRIDMSGTAYDSGFFILHAILFFLYTRTRITDGASIIKKYLWVYILSVLFPYISLFPYFSLDLKSKIDIYYGNISMPFYLIISFFVINLIFFAYMGLAIKSLYKHKKNMLHNYSNTQKVDLTWLINLSKGLLTIYLIALFSPLLIPLFDITPFYIDFAEYCFYAIFVYGIGIWGYKQGQIFVYSSPSNPIQKKKNIKAEDQGFSEYLIDYMHKHKPYLDNELSLYALAEQMDVSTHYISHILSNIIKKNFYEFVNSFRIEKVKERLIEGDNDKYTLLSIALDSGFNSKATFNRIFKQFTGFTPSQFINNPKRTA